MRFNYSICPIITKNRSGKPRNRILCIDLSTNKIIRQSTLPFTKPNYLKIVSFIKFCEDNIYYLNPKAILINIETYLL